MTDAILAFPLAYFMARIASGRARRRSCSSLVLLPLWSSYLVRVYAWRLILTQDGVAQLDARNGLGLPDQHLGYSNRAMWIVFSYIWLPFMILPVYGALERIPDSLLEASRDLGARGCDDVPPRHPAARAARASSRARSSPSR